MDGIKISDNDNGLTEHRFQNDAFRAVSWYVTAPASVQYVLCPSSVNLTRLTSKPVQLQSDLSYLQLPLLFFSVPFPF